MLYPWYDKTLKGDKASVKATKSGITTDLHFVWTVDSRVKL